jgi:hypothetical protein
MRWRPQGTRTWCRWSCAHGSGHARTLSTPRQCIRGSTRLRGSKICSSRKHSDGVSRLTMQHTTAHHGTPRHTTAHHSTPRHTTANRNAAQHHTTRRKGDSHAPDARWHRPLPAHDADTLAELRAEGHSRCTTGQSALQPTVSHAGVVHASPNSHWRLPQSAPTHSNTTARLLPSATYTHTRACTKAGTQTHTQRSEDNTNTKHWARTCRACNARRVCKEQRDICQTERRRLDNRRKGL